VAPAPDLRKLVMCANDAVPLAAAWHMTDAAALVRHRHWRPDPFALADASRSNAAAEDAQEPGSRVRLPLVARLAGGEPAAAPARPQLPRGGGAPGQPGPGEPSAPAAEPGGRAAASWSPGAQPAGVCATVTLLDTGYDPAAGLGFEGFDQGARHLLALPLALAEPQAARAAAAGAPEAGEGGGVGGAAPAASARPTPTADTPAAPDAQHGQGSGDSGGPSALDDADFPALSAAAAGAGPGKGRATQRGARRGRMPGKPGAPQAAPPRAAANAGEGADSSGAGAATGRGSALLVEPGHLLAASPPRRPSLGEAPQLAGAASGDTMDAEAAPRRGRVVVLDWPGAAAAARGGQPRHGPAAAAPRRGARQPGGAADEPAALPAAAGPALEALPQGGRGAAPAAQPAAGPRAPGAVLHVGFEYERRDGARFVLAPAHLPEARGGEPHARPPGARSAPRGAGPRGGAARVLLSRDLPLLLDAPRLGAALPEGPPPAGLAPGSDVPRSEDPDMQGPAPELGAEWRPGVAQLARIWVATPADAPVAFAMQPALRWQARRAIGLPAAQDATHMTCRVIPCQAGRINSRQMPGSAACLLPLSGTCAW